MKAANLTKSLKLWSSDGHRICKLRFIDMFFFNCLLADVQQTAKAWSYGEFELECLWLAVIMVMYFNLETEFQM